MPTKIYCAVFGSGLGHATRTESIVKSLDGSQKEFLFSSFDEGLDYLRRNGWNAMQCPSVDLEWSASGGFSSRDSFVRFPLFMLDFGRQVGFETRQLSKFEPKILISDSRLSAVFAGKIRSIPVITVLNQFKILFPPRFRMQVSSRFLERIEGDVLGLMWSLSEKVLMPDLPPPYTIGEANVAGTDVSSKVTYVGFMTPSFDIPKERLEKARLALGIDDRPFVFMQISGPGATKKRFVEIAISAADELAKHYNIVISNGLPDGNSTPRRLSNNAWFYEWCPIIEELFLLSDLLVARAGHTTISQCIGLGKPAVLVPIYNHSEQIWNAEKFQRLGLGLSLRAEQLSASSLASAVGVCIGDSKYKSAAERLREVSSRYRGVERASEIIQSYL